MSSQSVLFDAPGPRTVARHRVYTVVAVVVIVALLALIAWRLFTAGQLEYRLWEPFLTPRYITAILIDGVVATLTMAAAAVLGAVALGLVLGLGKISERSWVSVPSFLIVEFFRAVPVLLLMVAVFYSWGITRGETGAYWSVVVALSLYNGAVLAEVFRAGINAVPKGQAEAAYAVGMSRTQVTWIIQLPQAVKIMLPALISQCVVALKDTSLGYAVAAPGLTTVGRNVYQQFGNQVPTVIVIAAIYIVLNLILTALATYVQHKFVGEHNPVAASGTPTAG